VVLLQFGGLVIGECEVPDGDRVAEVVRLGGAGQTAAAGRPSCIFR
jgi:hypothetical protein